MSISHDDFLRIFENSSRHSQKLLLVQDNSRHGPQVCAMGLFVNFDSFFLKVPLMTFTTKISAPVRKHNKYFSITVSSDLIYFLKYCRHSLSASFCGVAMIQEITFLFVGSSVWYKERRSFGFGKFVLRG